MDNLALLLVDLHGSYRSNKGQASWLGQPPSQLEPETVISKLGQEIQRPGLSLKSLARIQLILHRSRAASIGMSPLGGLNPGRHFPDICGQSSCSLAWRPSDCR